MSQNGPEKSKHTSQTSEFWRYIFNTPQAGIVVSINGTIRQMNDTAVRMLGGQSSSDFVGRRFHETLISPEYIERTFEREQQLRGGQSSVPPMEVQPKFPYICNHERVLIPS